MIKISGVGRLGSDAEKKQTASGVSIATFSVACDAGYRKRTEWVRCAIFGKRAEGKLPDFLTKGTQLYFDGEPKMSAFTGKDGEARASLEVNVDELILLGGGKEAKEKGEDFGDDIPF